MSPRSTTIPGGSPTPCSPFTIAGASTAQARDAIAQTDGLGLILAPGCVLPLDVPDIHLRAVVQAVTSPSMIKTTK